MLSVCEIPRIVHELPVVRSVAGVLDKNRPHRRLLVDERAPFSNLQAPSSNKHSQHSKFQNLHCSLEFGRWECLGICPPSPVGSFRRHALARSRRSAHELSRAKAESLELGICTGPPG